MPRLELRLRDRRLAASLVLEPHRADVTSQFGEDGILARIFALIGTRNRCCVEFGAWDGRLYSNTHALLTADWSGVVIEGAPERYAELVATYAPHAERVTPIHAFVGWGATDGLDALLAALPEERRPPPDLDLVSIDVDGNDHHIWAAMATTRPRVVVIEFNPTCDNDLLLVQDADPALNWGSSLLALVELGRAKGYELVATTEVNAIFVLAEEFPKLGIADNSPDALHFPRNVTRLAQGYDGTLLPAGVQCLLWRNLPLTLEDYQVLPAALRRYVF